MLKVALYQNDLCLNIFNLDILNNNVKPFISKQ